MRTFRATVAGPNIARCRAGGCQLTYQSSSLTTMGPTGTLSHQTGAPSAPGPRLQAQLEHIHAHWGGRIYGFLRLAPHMGRRVGGQGVVVFAEHALSPLKHYAIKFFLSPGSFMIERAAACNPVRYLHESRCGCTNEGLHLCTGSGRHIRAQICCDKLAQLTTGQVARLFRL